MTWTIAPYACSPRPNFLLVATHPSSPPRQHLPIWHPATKIRDQIHGPILSNKYNFPSHSGNRITAYLVFQWRHSLQLRTGAFTTSTTICTLSLSQTTGNARHVLQESPNAKLVVIEAPWFIVLATRSNLISPCINIGSVSGRIQDRGLVLKKRRRRLKKSMNDTTMRSTIAILAMTVAGFIDSTELATILHPRTHVRRKFSVRMRELEIGSSNLSLPFFDCSVG